MRVQIGRQTVNVQVQSSGVARASESVRRAVAAEQGAEARSAEATAAAAGAIAARDQAVAATADKLNRVGESPIFGVVAADTIVADELRVDATFASYLSGGNPFTAFDGNDYDYFDRALDKRGTVIGGVDAFNITAAGLQLQGRPRQLYGVYYGRANGSGVLTIVHGDSNLPNKIDGVSAFHELTADGSGVVLPLTMYYVDGTNLVFNASANAANRRCRVVVWQQETGAWA